jgi:hypothetical protein
MLSFTGATGCMEAAQMNVGDRVRVIGIPDRLPAGNVAENLSLRTLFHACIGRVFPIVAVTEELAELEVGEVVGIPAYMHSIWLEPAFLELVETTPEEESMLSQAHCSFCGKSQQDGRKLVAGPTLFICGECVQGCVRLLAQGHPEWVDQHLELVKGLRKGEPT